MEIKTITSFDSKIIKDIAKIHYSVLNESFLNNFGIKFLEIIYTNILKSSQAIFIISEENDTITGFLLAVTDYSKFMKMAIAKRKVYIGLLILLTLIKKPHITYKLVSSLLKVTKEDPHAELQFIAVSPEHQGKSIGTKLIQQLDKEMQKKGIKKYFVGTKATNELSNKFYQKIGFAKAYTKSYFGDELNYYVSRGI